jgi:hypothetical protein
MKKKLIQGISRIPVKVVEGDMTNMKKRVQKRVPVRLECELISGNVNYPAFIENISKDGLFLRIAYLNEKTNITPGKQLKLKIRITSGEILNVLCSEVWSEKNAPGSQIQISGMKIIDPPEKYREFLSSL